MTLTLLTKNVFGCAAHVNTSSKAGSSVSKAGSTRLARSASWANRNWSTCARWCANLAGDGPETGRQFLRRAKLDVVLPSIKVISPHIIPYT